MVAYEIEYIFNGETFKHLVIAPDLQSLQKKTLNRIQDLLNGGVAITGLVKLETW